MRNFNFNNKNFIIFIVVVLCIFTVNKIAFTSGKNLLGKQAPEIKIAKWFNTDKNYTLSSLKGKVVLLEFWAIWCPPCKQSIPHLSELYNKYSKKGLVVIGVTSDKESNVKKFIKQMQIDYFIALDSGGKTNNSYAIRGIPSAYLVDVNGKIAWQGHPMNLENSEIESALKSVIKKSKEKKLPVW